MEFEDQEEQEEEMGFEPSYDSHSSRVKMSGVELSSITPTGQQQQRKPRYRECLKNHAVGIGGHAVDGCGEFMPAGAEGTLDALKCAACNCHRNFHRKETELGSPNSIPTTDLYFHHHQPPQFTPYFRAPAGYLHVAGQQRPLALPSTSGGGGGHSREDQEDASNHGSSRKRFRTKFTQEQKDKMLALAERLGWRIQKHDEAVVQQFCNENGVKRHVLKVWMHNNKHTLDIGALSQSGDMQCKRPENGSALAGFEHGDVEFSRVRTFVITEITSWKDQRLSFSFGDKYLL